MLPGSLALLTKKQQFLGRDTLAVVAPRRRALDWYFLIRRSRSTRTGLFHRTTLLRTFGDTSRGCFSLSASSQGNEQQAPTAIPGHSAGEVRRRSSSPKLQSMDTGLVTASSSVGLGSWRQEPDRWGRLVECAVGAHLCNWEFSSGWHDVFYWMERNQEVDFVVAHEGRLFAIEVKSGRVRALHGMERFVKSHPSAVPLLVGTGGIPLEEFRSKPPTAWFMT